MEGAFISEVDLQIPEQKRGFGIACFSESFEHELMWAHYADHFHGICISYNAEKLRKSLSASNGHERIFTRLTYDEKCPSIAQDDLNPAIIALSSKNHRWNYEREWRMFGDNGRNFYEDMNAVSRVYLGSRVDEDVEAHIVKQLNGIPVSKMHVEGYRITFRNVR